MLPLLQRQSQPLHQCARSVRGHHGEVARGQRGAGLDAHRDAVLRAWQLLFLPLLLVVQQGKHDLGSLLRERGRGGVAPRAPQQQLLQVRALVAGHPLEERAQAADACREGAETLKLVHDDAQVAQNVIERSVALRNHTQLDLVAEVQWSNHEAGNDLNEIAVADREELEVALGADNLPEVAHHLVQAALDLAALELLAAVEGDGLRVLAHAHQRVPEVGFPLKLAEVQANELAPKLRGDHRAHACVGEDGPEELRVDGEQDAAEADQVDDARQQRDEQVQRVLGEGPDILGDPLVGVVHLPRGLQRVVRAIGVVDSHDPSRHPLAPAKGQLVPLELVEHSDGHPCHERRHKLLQHQVELLGVLVAEGRPEVAADVGEGHGHPTV
mmetsp:Transcript_40738/g.91798  ORF Transcript_40738/g.91798 Transcript_40738/m.91798 type:complete len:385 (-) Transcript_40738:377-1531(-)